MSRMIVESDYSVQTVKDALARAIFNLRKNRLSGSDDEEAQILEDLLIKEDIDERTTGQAILGFTSGRNPGDSR